MVLVLVQTSSAHVSLVVRPSTGCAGDGEEAEEDDDEEVVVVVVVEVMLEVGRFFLSVVGSSSSSSMICKQHPTDERGDGGVRSIFRTHTLE